MLSIASHLSRSSARSRAGAVIDFVSVILLRCLAEFSDARMHDQTDQLWLQSQPSITGKRPCQTKASSLPATTIRESARKRGRPWNKPTTGTSVPTATTSGQRARPINSVSCSKQTARCFSPSTAPRPTPWRCHRSARVTTASSARKRPTLKRTNAAHRNFSPTAPNC